MQKYAYLSKYPVIEQYNIMMEDICRFLDQVVAMEQLLSYSVKYRERSTIIFLRFPQSKALIKVYFRNSVFRLDALNGDAKVNQQDFNITNFDQLLMADIFSSKVYPAAREIAKNSMFKIVGSIEQDDGSREIDSLKSTVKELQELNETYLKNEAVYKEMIDDLTKENKKLVKASKTKKKPSAPILGDGED